MEGLNMKNLWLYSSQRLKKELVFVKNSVDGCSSVMFSKDSKGRNSLVGKINGEKFVIDIFTDPTNLNHNDFEDVVEVLKKSVKNG